MTATDGLTAWHLPSSASESLDAASAPPASSIPAANDMI